MVSLETGICSSCGQRRKLQHLRRLYAQAAERLQRGEAAYKQQRYGEARKTLESLIEDFGDALYRSHLVIYSSLHHLTALCVELGDRPAAGGYCRRAISCLEEMFPAYHTETAMMRQELAHIEWRLESHRAVAVDEFDRALEIVAVCYGKDRPAFMELTEAMAACAAGEPPPPPS